MLYYIYLIKLAFLIAACYLLGMKWDRFWKSIDYSIREWVAARWYGRIVELLVDAMHHSITGLFIIYFATNWYPSLVFYAAVSFALGMITVDIPREKERMLELIRLLMVGKLPEIEEAAKKLAEEIIEGASEEETNSSEEVRKIVAEVMNEGVVE